MYIIVKFKMIILDRQIDSISAKLVSENITTFLSLSFFKSVKNFFGKNNTPPKTTQSHSSNHSAPRVVNFGGNEEGSAKKQAGEEQVDLRYNRVEAKDSWKELGIKRDEAVQGQIPILVDSKYIQTKSSSGHYVSITFILSDYQIFIKMIDRLLHFPLGKIDRLQKYTNKQNHHKLLIGLKDGRVFKFRIFTENMWKKVYDHIESFAFVRNKKQFFAFKHFQANKMLQDTYRGWQSFDFEKEFMRLGIELMPHTQNVVSQYWSDFKVLDNKDGKICSTYADKIIVPSRISYDCLVRCAKFRSRCRLPALTYIYQFQNGSFSGLYRSSQSKVGVSNSRSPEDELMLRLIGDPKIDPKETLTQGDINCVIYDARNKMAAFGNKVAGKGYESQEFYPNCKVDFLNIPNIHAVRQSYHKALKAAQGEDSKFYSALADSEWYDYVFLIMEGASQIAKSLTEGHNVLIHCSDGWDRTSQLCSLAGIFLDPYYRTIMGFHALIDKDWIRFGHQFATRMGQGVNNPTGEEKSPVFFQFLDCVSQLLYQYPTDFEFNYRYLQDMAQFAQTNLFGNFLCNCELEMKNNNIETKTVSLWSYFLKNRQLYLNPYFLESHPRLRPSTAQKHFRFWKEHFLQYVDGFQDIYDIYSCRFTQYICHNCRDNLDIMYKHVKQQKSLLQEKLNESKNILDGINKQIEKQEAKPESEDKQ